MATFAIPYTTSGNYTYDSNTIEVTGGVARLKDLGLTTNLQGYWKLDSNLNDESINGYNLASSGVATYNTGVLGQALYSYPYSYKYSAPNFSVGTGNFTIQSWIKFDHFSWNQVYLYLFTGGAAVEVSTNTSGLIAFITFNSGTGATGIANTTVLSPGTWYLITCVRNGTSLYLHINDTYEFVTGTVRLVNSDQLIIGNNSGFTRQAYGYIDNLAIWTKALSVSDVSFIYNSGVGRNITQYASASPTIYKTTGNTDTGITLWSGFTETLGVGNVGSVAYQLSTDGATWKYWNGGSWVVAGAGNYNTYSTVNTNIGSFDISDNIYVKSFLISDGSQAVELDENQITYFTNQNPTVNAGTDKSCKDHQTISPFSDCSFSDPDGTIVKAEYKIVGEVDVWTEIPIGGYGTLQEAVQAWQYTFDNMGSITASLRVTDNGSATAEDSLTVTVSKYTRTVNITSSITGEHLAGLNFDPGDGSGFLSKTSPFTYSWEYGSYTLIIFRDIFNQTSFPISVSDESNLNLALSPTEIVSSCEASVAIHSDIDKLCIICWLVQNGQLVSNPTSCTVKLYECDGDKLYEDSSSSVNLNGHFVFQKTPSGLPIRDNYVLNIDIISNGVTISSTYSVGELINRSVWGEIVNSNQVSGSFGEYLKLLNDKVDLLTTNLSTANINVGTLLDEALGKWVLDPTGLTLTYYKRDGTILKTFNLSTTSINVQPIISRNPQ